MFWLCSHSQASVSGPIWPRPQLQWDGPGGVKEGETNAQPSLLAKTCVGDSQGTTHRTNVPVTSHCQGFSCISLASSSPMLWILPYLLSHSGWEVSEHSLSLPPKPSVPNLPDLQFSFSLSCPWVLCSWDLAFQFLSSSHRPWLSFMLCISGHLSILYCKEIILNTEELCI